MTKHLVGLAFVLALGGWHAPWFHAASACQTVDADGFHHINRVCGWHPHHHRHGRYTITCHEGKCGPWH